MKKHLLFLITCCALLFTSFSLKAQSYRDGVGTRKVDKAVVLASPNPAQDYIILKSLDTNLKIKSVTFFSVLGIQVASYAIDKQTAELQIDRLKPGKYLMRYVMSDDSQKVMQIIKL